MPPQQPKGPPDLAYNGRNFGAHDFTGSRGGPHRGCSDPAANAQAQVAQYSPPRRTARSDSEGTASPPPSYPPMAATASFSGGAVPGLNASRIAVVVPGPARWPVLTSTRISLMPGGTRNGIAGLSASAALKKSLAIGAERWPPVASRPRWRGLS